MGGTVSTSHPLPLRRTQADASLPGRRAPIPSRPSGDVFGCQGAGKVPGLGRDRAPLSQRGGRAGARQRPLPTIPPFSPSQLAHPPPLTFPHSPPHGPETQKVCFSWLCAPLRQLRPRPSGWAQRLLSLSLSSSFFPFSAFFFLQLSPLSPAGLSHTSTRAEWGGGPFRAALTAHGPRRRRPPAAAAAAAAALAQAETQRHTDSEQFSCNSKLARAGLTSIIGCEMIPAAGGTASARSPWLSTANKRKQDLSANSHLRLQG